MNGIDAVIVVACLLANGGVGVGFMCRSKSAGDDGLLGSKRAFPGET